jgi:chaperonin GroEL (HSP60 family)
MSEHAHRTGADIGSDDVTTDVRSRNISLGVAVGEVVRTTLGPMGMDKLLIDGDGMGIVTNDGTTVLKEMADSPLLNLIRAAAKGQAATVGDGTTTTAVLTGELLNQAESLLELGLHPTTVAHGYLTALRRVRETLTDLSYETDGTDDENRRQVLSTAMTSKGAVGDVDLLVDLLVEAIDRVGGAHGFDSDEVFVEKIPGRFTSESAVVTGLYLENGAVHPGMPKALEDATIALVDGDVDPEASGADATATAATVDEVHRITEYEAGSVDELVESLCTLGVDVLVASGHVDERVRGPLATADIYATQQPTDETFERLVRMTGANPVGSPAHLGPDDLAAAGRVFEQLVDGETQTDIESIVDPEAVTIELRGTMMNNLDELHRALEDGLAAARLLAEERRVLPGGGAAETAAATDLRTFAPSVGAREQLAVEAFADALETVPRTLFENAGSDPIDGMTELRAAHDRGKHWTGVDGVSGEPADMSELGVLDPLSVKCDAFEGATDTAVMLLRIDDEISAADDP